jgi:hypothetical protein
MHQEIGHFNEKRTLIEIYKKFYWHNKNVQVHLVVKAWKECQLVRIIGSMKLDVEDLKNIPVCDLFYKVALDIAKLLLETNDDNKDILVAIDHYSKWFKTKVVKDHTIATIVRFLEEDIIYKYGVLKFILTNNGGEWSAKFDNLCKVYDIQH